MEAQLTFATNNGAIDISGYIGTSSIVVIPSETNGYPVTMIEGTSVNTGFPTNMTSVVIPNSVTTIGDFAFYDSSLTSVMIPDSVTNIGEEAFGGCNSMTNITVDAANPAFASVGGVLYDKGVTLSFQCPAGMTGNYTIPTGVTTIGYGSFDRCHLTNIIMPNTLTTIGGGPAGWIPDGGFQFFPGTSLTIPDSVTVIGISAFAYSYNLTNVVIGNGLTAIGEDAFDYCPFKSLVFPASLKSIIIYAFSYCTNLTQLYFRGNAPYVQYGSYAFYGESPVAYYLPGTTNWSSVGIRTGWWYQPQPQILGSYYGPGDGLGMQTNGFGFTLSWATNASAVVEASTNLQSWAPIATNTMVNGTNAFVDSTWTSYPHRFYRARPQ